MENNGFTLVELAIVMVIIGLLIGGVIKGQQLIENAKITSTIEQIDAYRTAYITFQDMYGQMAGDMRNARSRIPGCDDAHYCLNGNGDSFIGQAGGSTGRAHNQALITTLPRVETTMFWKHLTMANLITGVVPSANTAQGAWGETHPASPFGGGFTVQYSTTKDGQPNAGHWLRIDSTLGTNNTAQGTNPISAKVLSIIDRKVDDGIPRSGWIQSDNLDGQSDAGMGGGCEITYNMLNDTRGCLLLARF